MTAGGVGGWLALGRRAVGLCCPCTTMAPLCSARAWLCPAALALLRCSSALIAPHASTVLFQSLILPKHIITPHRFHHHRSMGEAQWHGMQIPMGTPGTWARSRGATASMSPCPQEPEVAGSTQEHFPIAAINIHILILIFHVLFCHIQFYFNFPL